MNLRDDNLKAAIARLTPAERAAIALMIRTGQRTRAAIEAIHRLKQILKALARGNR
jgi:hypothetical protein